MKRSLIIAVLALGACTTVQTRQIDGVEWRAVDINGVPAAEGGPVTLRLDAGQASGNAGCNRYNGGYQLQRPDQRIRFSAITSTRMACAPALMDQERRYVAILEAVSGYSFYGDGSLSLIAADGRAIRYRRN